MPAFDFAGLAFILGGISLGMVGVVFAGIMLFPDYGERVKRDYLPTILAGLILVGIAGIIIGFFAP